MRVGASVPVGMALWMVLASGALAQGGGAGAAPAPEIEAVGEVLDAFHLAASKADEATYFGLMAEGGVFLGTDATERWDKAAFRAFAHPYFSQGRGWTFTPRDRHVDLSADGRFAWFDELLDSAKYGECRGSGVLEKVDGAWRIQQYHLTIPVPNALAEDLVAHIRRAVEPPPRTLRLDYVHTGNATEERFALERWVLEPLPWPGNPRRPLDDSNLGPYAFELVDRATQQTLYSRGFASIFGEWQSTAEAKGLERAFPESVRFPAPVRPARVVLKKRDAQGYFSELASFAVDPADPAIDRAAPPAPAAVIALQKSGDPADKVDLLLLGDGYTAAEQAKFETDARRLMELLFAEAPFAEHRQDFNVWALAPPATESGISRPSTGLHRRSPVGATYDAFGSERYVLTFDVRAFREAASHAPYDFVEILVNGTTYGGGGIFQLYGTVAVDSIWAPYVFVHEFGHHFAALADEYYTSPVAYEAAQGPRPEPWERNVTADPRGGKWGDLIAAGTPLPTPWEKEAFEAFQRDVQARRRTIRASGRPEAEMDALFREEQARATLLLGQGEHAHHVGAFEGASYEAKGLYRPQADCIMFSRDEVGFCAVCRRAIEEVIRLYAE